MDHALTLGRMRLRDKIMVGLAVTAALVVTALLVLRQGTPDLAECERAMRQAYVAGATLANRPPECAGVETADLEEIVARVLTEEEPGGGTDRLTSY